MLQAHIQSLGYAETSITSDSDKDVDGKKPHFDPIYIQLFTLISIKHWNIINYINFFFVVVLKKIIVFLLRSLNVFGYFVTLLLN